MPPSNYPVKAKAYLTGLARTGTLRGAVTATHVSYHSPYRWREELKDFEEEEKIAKEHFGDYLEGILFESVASNSTLLIFALKGLSH